MSFTPLGLVLGLLVIPGANNTLPKMESSYSTAYSMAEKEKKPLVVFLGHGKAGAEQTLPKGVGDANKLLTKDFVTLYVDVDSAEGKQLAEQFRVESGLVISDRTVHQQALRHDGPVSPEELQTYLTKYSDPKLEITTTEMGGRLKVASPYLAVPTFGNPYNNCPSCRKGY